MKWIKNTINIFTKQNLKLYKLTGKSNLQAEKTTKNINKVKTVENTSNTKFASDSAIYKSRMEEEECMTSEHEF